MNAKSLVTTFLLLLVGIGVITAVVKELRGPFAAAPGQDTAATLPAEGLVVYYFHGNVRCPTCQAIETYAHDAIDTGFASALAEGDVIWQVVNYESPAATHFVDDYDIVAPTVVLLRRQDGQSGEWRNLARVWELVGNRAEFVEYIQQEAAQMLTARQDRLEIVPPKEEI